MPERSTYPSGTPAWVDLSTTDPERAKAFYGEVFGWDFRREAVDHDYWTALVDGKAVAGIMAPQAGWPAGWSTNVAVDDLTVARSAVIDAGGASRGEVVELPDGGRIAGFTDSQGAPMFLMQSTTFPGAELVNEPGAFIWSELICGDCPDAARFYGDVFGWGAQAVPAPDGSEAVMFTGPEGPLGSARDPKSSQMPPTWLVYFACEDADRCADTIPGAGGAVAIAPIDADFGRLGAAVDATGAPFAFIATD